MAIKVRVTGLKKLNNDFRRINNRVSKRTNRGMRKVLKKTEEAARKFAPMDEGTLRSAIGSFSRSRADGSGQYFVDVDLRKRTPLTRNRKRRVSVGRYAPAMELGRRNGRAIKYSLPHPVGAGFIRRAFEVAEDNVEKLEKDIVREIR